MLANVAPELAEAVAEGLGLEVPPPMPKVLEKPAKPEVQTSSALSLFARPGDGSVKTRRIAILVDHGVDVASLTALHTTLGGAGAVPRFVGKRLGAIQGAAGDSLDVEITMEAAPAVVFDAVVIPEGEQAVTSLCGEGQALEFLKDQYRHCKPMLALGAGAKLLAAANIPVRLPNDKPDPGILLFDASAITKAIAAFAAAIGKHRHFDRQTDPPLV
jgi:catalase